MMQLNCCSGQNSRAMFLLMQYDHQEFPGIVPRTFLGPLVVSTAALPLVKLSDYLGATKLTSQYIGG